MSKILLVGNSGLKHNGSDGQTIKVRLYLKKILEEGHDCSFVDLEDFLKNPISALRKIKRGICLCDRIVLISAKRGCKYLIPFINRVNKKRNKTFILPLVGTSVLHYSIDSLSQEQQNDFLVNGNYSLCKPNKKMMKELKKVDYILPETELLVKVFEGFYGLSNVFQLNNFREIQVRTRNTFDSKKINILFLSRVMEEKGVFDIIDVVKTLCRDGLNISLDIYGKIAMNKHQTIRFDSSVDGTNIRYCGIVSNEKVIDIFSQYKLFVFPTHFVGEGTPGVIVESLISGVPVLTADFPQAKFLLCNGKDSVFYKMFDNKDLKEKIMYIIRNKELLSILANNAMNSGKKYTYDHERKTFLKYICGVEED